MKNTLIAVFALSAGLGLALSLPAAAEKGKGPCAEDAAKFCKDVKPGEGRVAVCLKEHEKELSQACRDRKARAGEKRGEKRANKRGGGGQACLGAYGKGFSSGFRNGFKMRAGLGGKDGRKFAKGGKVCKADREKFCSTLKPGEGSVRDCLQKNIKNLSEGCKVRQEKLKVRLEEKEKKG